MMFTGYWASVVALSGFILMIVLVKLAKSKFNIPSARKAIHTGGGLLAMTFPWLGEWNYILPAVIVACFILLTLRSTSKFKKDKNKTASGDFLYDTGNLKSYGEVIFPIVMALLIWLTKLNPFLFVTPMAILALSDSSAALLGSKYGKANMACKGEDKKTKFGSLVFFVTCLIIVPTTALLFTDLALKNILIISFMVAIAATIFEMTSSHGMDNLLVPLSAFLMLNGLVDLPYETILIKLAYSSIVFVAFALPYFVGLVSAFSYLQLAMMISISVIGSCWYATISIIVVSLSITFVQKYIKKLNICIVKPSILCSTYSIILLSISSAGLIPSGLTAGLFYVGNLFLISFTLININKFLPTPKRKKSQVTA
ncbi:MAG: hypothetical protein EOM05_06490 [Clostridia bacterium]|nr:hypothetical protein [Clostridia bacterium]